MAKIELSDVSVTFNAYQQKRVSFKEYLMRGMFWGRGTRRCG
jgi:lipopolysaccharide transport system ATP-binding protein